MGNYQSELSLVCGYGNTKEKAIKALCHSISHHFGGIFFSLKFK